MLPSKLVTCGVTDIVCGNGLFCTKGDGMDCYIVENKYAYESDTEVRYFSPLTINQTSIKAIL